MNSKSKVITDNWLLQNAAELLSKEIDIGNESKILYFEEKSLKEKIVYAGAIQIECLASLLEQIVFYDKLFVMKGFTSMWMGKSKEFDDLLTGMVVEIDPNYSKYEEKTELYIDSFCKEPVIKKIHINASKAWEKLKNGCKVDSRDTFPNQVIRGTAEYLSIADVKGYIYCPHPTRTKFIESTLYTLKFKKQIISKFNELVDNSRVKLAQKYLSDSEELIKLTCRIPSVSLLCLRESNSTISPITVARQLRESYEFKMLRKTLSAWEFNLKEKKLESAEKAMGKINSAILEVERKLKIRDLNENQDGFSQFKFKGIPLNVPDFLRQPVFKPQHTTAIHKLITTGVDDLYDLLKKSIGIDSRLLIEELSKL